MFQAAATGSLSGMGISKLVVAIGGLGTAAYGVVDITKSFGGGISNRGFGDIKRVVSPFFPVSENGAAPPALSSALATLRSNWLNGMALGDQKSIAKGLIKLNLAMASAPRMAAATGVDANLLASIAGKIATGEALNSQETDTYGRFDVLVSALLDQGYQRGDQRYRNSAKLAAVPVAIVLALLGAWAIFGSRITNVELAQAFVAGLLATPLAPIAKDVSTAIQAGANVAQFWKK